MTSINAIRFDSHSGAMVCDEQRHWNVERMKIYAADKVRSVVPSDIRERYHLAAAYGNTGTSAIGDELRMTICREVENLYRAKCLELGGAPSEFLTVEGVARLAWRVICRMKHRHIDDALLQKYGFTTSEFIQEQYTRNGSVYSIKNEPVIQDALENIAGDPGNNRADAVFGNGGIIAGFDRENGFQIYSFSMKEGFMEPVESGYVALGSGGDTTNFVLPRFFNQAGVEGRIHGVNPVEGVCAVLDAVNMATEHNLGVGGYYNIILFDLQNTGGTGIYREINDHRSRLSCEAIRSVRAGYITQEHCRTIISGLLFEQKDADWGEEYLWSVSKDSYGMLRLLRGYPVVYGE